MPRRGRAAHGSPAKAWCARIAEHVHKDLSAKPAMSVCGVGAFTASALAADVGDLSQFKNGCQFGAWLGLVPRQHSSGGKARLGRITKRGDAYLRFLMVMGAKAAMRVAAKKDDDVSRWVCQLRERVGWQKACVALANKNARHLWVLLAGRATGQDSPGDAAPATAKVQGALRRSRARVALLSPPPRA